MKHSFKIMTTLVAMCTIMAVMVVGIWAATSQTTNVTASVTFTAQDVDVQFVGKIMGSATQTTDWAQNVDASRVNLTSVSWDIGDLSFDASTKVPIRIGIAIRNNGVDTNPYCKTTVTASLPTGVTMTYEQLGGSTASPTSMTYSRSEFIPSLVNTLTADSNCKATASSGATLPAYNPTSSALTTGKVYYFEIVFTLTNWDNDVEPFAIAFGMNVQSSKIL